MRGNETDRSWRERASCAERPDLTRLFYSDDRTDIATAKELCASCPVREACMTEALSRPAEEDWGVWGGMDERERFRYRTDLRRRGLLRVQRACRWCGAAFVPEGTRQYCTEACKKTAEHHYMLERSRRRNDSPERRAAWQARNEAVKEENRRRREADADVAVAGMMD